MTAIQLGAQSTIEITKNVIDTLKHEGLISCDSDIRINENLQVVKPVSQTFTSKYDILKNSSPTTDQLGDEWIIDHKGTYWKKN